MMLRRPISHIVRSFYSYFQMYRFSPPIDSNTDSMQNISMSINNFCLILLFLFSKWLIEMFCVKTFDSQLYTTQQSK